MFYSQVCEGQWIEEDHNLRLLDLSYIDQSGTQSPISKKSVLGNIGVVDNSTFTPTEISDTYRVTGAYRLVALPTPFERFYVTVTSAADIARVSVEFVDVTDRKRRQNVIQLSA